jgi:Flp pilus assembly pilin Flp
MSRNVHDFGKDESGATALGHGLVAALVLVATIAAVLGIGVIF